MSFLFPDIKDRTDSIKELANKLNAYYCFGIDSIKDDFNIISSNQNENAKKNVILGKLEDWAINEQKESNVIVGNIEGYDYCFLEYLHKSVNKYDSTKWISIFRLRLKDNYPNFNLKTMKNMIPKVGCAFLLISFFLLGIPLTIIKEKGIDNIGAIFIACLMWGLWLFCLIIIIKWLINITYGQKKYKIRSRRFKNKYVILGDPDIDKIENLFTKKVCSKINKYPSDFNFTIKDNILINDNIGLTGQLSYETCDKLLKESLFLAKVFDERNQNNIQPEHLSE